MHAALRRVLVTGLLLCFAAVPAGCGSSTSSGSFSGASPTAGNLQAGAYPTPQDETFQGCPPQGDGGDSALNIKKNRIDSGTWQSDTVSNLVSLPYPQGVVKQPRASWSAADAATVAQSEGRPLQVEGYLLLVRHEGTESPNCHDANERDFHMWLAGSPGGIGDRASSMIVEVTPRSRALNANWQPDSRLLGLTGHHVRISGWLLLDQEHPEQVGKTRGTLWEIHPVMKIEVEQGGTWTDLNDTSLQITRGSVNSGSNSGGSGTSSSRHRHRRSHSRNGA